MQNPEADEEPLKSEGGTKASWQVNIIVEIHAKVGRQDKAHPKADKKSREVCMERIM